MRIRHILSLLSPLLQSLSGNPYASYLAISINAVKEAVKMGDPEEETPGIITLTKYLSTMKILSLMDNNNADMLRIWNARDLALNVNNSFKW